MSLRRLAPPEVQPASFAFNAANAEWCAAQIAKYPPGRQASAVIPLLWKGQAQEGWVSHPMIEEIAKSNAAAGSGKRKIADLFNSYMDESAIEARGMAPIEPQLKEIAAIKDKKQLANALGKTLRADVDALNNTNFHTNHLFGLWVAPGFNDADHYTPYLMQGGIQLPDRLAM